MTKIKETDLFYPVKNLLESNGYKLCQEINHCDIVAMKEEQLLIVELKVNLTVDLLIQAVKRQRLTESVYIAVPKNKKMKSLKGWNDLSLLIKRLGLGLILVSVEDKSAEFRLHPELFDIMKSMNRGKKKRDKLIQEFNGRSYDNNIGGSTRQKIMTSYKDKALYIASCLDLYGPLSPKQLREYGSDPNKTYSILSKNFYNWFYRVENGIYGITEEGKKAIVLYKEVIMIHKKKLMNN